MNRIRCPIHNYINIQDNHLQVVDLPEVQRLRGIKQLGMAYHVYPGARHTRFEHSLGVYHLGSVISDILELSRGDRELIMLSGLLHDVGHGPFSHIMDSIGTTGHEERSKLKILNGEIGELLTSMDLNPSDIANTITGLSRLSPFISSEIDIDRLDYLLRDAHYTGVSSGVDPGRLTAVMKMEEGRLVFRESGLGAVEALLLARFMMYPYVYYHHTARSAQMMLTRAMTILLRSGEIDEEALWDMDDISLVALLRESPGFPGSLMKMLDQRRLYKRGWEMSLGQISGEFLDHSPAEVVDILKRLRAVTDPGETERVIAEIIDIEPEQVILDFPIPPQLNDHEIWISKRDGSIVPGSEVSHLISILEKAQLDHWKVRVFVLQKYRERAAYLLDTHMISLLDIQQ